MGQNEKPLFRAYVGSGQLRTCGRIGLGPGSASSGSRSISDEVHSAVIRAALMIGHHLSISAFWKARRASGVCWSRGMIS